MKYKARETSTRRIRLLTVLTALIASMGLLSVGGCPTGLEEADVRRIAGDMFGIPEEESGKTVPEPGTARVEEITEELLDDPEVQEDFKGDKGDEGDKGDKGDRGDDGGTITAHSQLSGLDADDHPQYVMNGEANAVTGPMLASAAVGLPKIDTGGAGGNQIMKFVQGQGLVWADDEIGPPDTGDITAVYADDGLCCDTLTGDAHISVGEGQGITVSPDAVGVDTNWADGRYVNELQAGSVSTGMIQDGAVAQEKIDASGEAVGFVLKTTGTAGYLYWDEDRTDGDDSPWQQSGSDIYYNVSGGKVGIGISPPLDQKLHVDGSVRLTNDLYVGDDVDVAGKVIVTDDVEIDDNLEIYNGDGGPMAVQLRTYSDHGRLEVYGPNASLIARIRQGELDNSGEFGVYGPSSSAEMWIRSDGKSVIEADYIFGNIEKDFRIANPNDPSTEIYYSCLEGPEAAAYIRGTARLVDGFASVPFPEHFRAVAAKDAMTIQLTPRSADSKGLAVVHQGIDGFKVRELLNGTGTYEFNYTAVAVRKGHEDYQVIREAVHRRRD